MALVPYNLFIELVKFRKKQLSLTLLSSFVAMSFLVVFLKLFLAALGHLMPIISVFSDIICTCKIAKKLPRAQAPQNPAGMVLVDRQGDAARASSCCS